MESENGLTVCIPVYNEVSSIERTVNSVVSQCERVLISDNASNDGTGEVCKSLAARFRNVSYYRNEKNLGALENWHNLLGRVDTPYVMFIGAHDYIGEGYCRKLLDKMTKNESLEIAMGGLWGERSGVKEEYGDFSSWEGGGLGDPCSRVKSFLFSRSPLVWLAYGVYRTKTYKELFDRDLPDYGVDVFFLLKVLAKGKCVIEPSVKYYAWVRDEGCSVSSSMERILGVKAGSVDERRILNKYKYDKYVFMCEVCALSALGKLLMRFMAMVRFGIFRAPGMDLSVYILYLPVKIVRMLRRSLSKWAG